eukprot:6198531-Pleurochrysis_carterae.AAC.1
MLVGFAIYEPYVRKSVMTTEAAPFKIGAPTSGCGSNARACAACRPLGCVEIALASMHHKQGVPAPGKEDVRRSTNIITRKGGGKGPAAGRRAPGLLEAPQAAANQGKRVPEFP